MKNYFNKFIFSSNSVYNNKTFLYNYGHNYYRIVRVKSCRSKGFEIINKNNFDTIKPDINSLESLRCSLSRTKRNIREIVLCNDFEYFVTLTINSKNVDRFSLDDVQDHLKKILKKIKRKNKDFKYLFITEKHKNGAFHFHGVVSSFPSCDIYKNDFGYFSSYIFDEYLGFNSFSKIKDYVKCANYITKYISKDCVKNSSNQIYISSRGLKKAIKEEIPFFDFKPSYSNDFCDILDLNFEHLSILEKYKFIFNLKKEGF